MTNEPISPAEGPPAGLSPPLAALWWAGRGPAGWDRAHALVQDEPGPEAAWVHAHLHRMEGDRDNAAYWYARAGRPPGRWQPGDGAGRHRDRSPRTRLSPASVPRS